MLAPLPYGDYLIIKLPNDDDLRARLSDLGMIEGTSMKIKSFLPFGGPAIIEVRSACYGLRRTTLSKIGLQKL